MWITGSIRSFGGEPGVLDRIGSPNCDRSILKIQYALIITLLYRQGHDPDRMDPNSGCGPQP